MLNYVRSYLMAVLLMVLTLPAIVGAQQDLRVNDEPFTRAVPADSRIQSAARIGERSLIVWGNTFPDKHGVRQPTLMLQVAVGDTLLHTPLMLHDPLARPTRMVTVVSLIDRFLVIWSDRRANAPGLYFMRVDTNGRQYEFPRRLSTTTVSTSELFTAGTPELGIMIGWNTIVSGRPSSYTARFNANGDPLYAPSTLDSTYLAAAIRYDLPDRNTVFLTTSMRAYLVRSDGTFDPRTIPLHAFSVPSFLANDFSLVTSPDSTLHIYGSLWDSQPTRIIPIPGLGEALPWTATMLRNHAGAFVVRWITGTTSGRSGGLYYGPHKMYTHEIQLDEQWAPVGPHRIDSISVGAECGTNIPNRFTFFRTEVNRRCGSVTDLRIYFDVTCGQSRWIAPVYSDFRSIPPSFRMISSTDTVPQSCGSSLSITTARISSDTISQVSIQGFSDSIRASAPSASEQLNVAQTMPGIFERDGQLMTAWVQNQPSHSPVARWNPADPPARDHFEFVAPDISHPSPGSWSSFGVWFGGAESEESRVHSRSGLPVIAHLQYMLDKYHYVSVRGTEMYTTTEFERFTVAIPGKDAWKTVFSKEGFGRSPYEVESVSFDLSTRRTTLAIARRPRFDPMDRWLVEVNETGDSITVHPRFLLKHRNLSVVATGRNSLLAIVADTAFVIENGVVTNRLPLSPSEGRGLVQKLEGGRFLRHYNPGGDLDSLVVEVFSNTGIRLAHSRILNRAVDSTIIVVQRSGDGLLALLWGDSNGVSATFLDGNTLFLHAHNMPIGSSRDSVGRVAAILREDSLFAIWEDFRDGQVDIYGTVQPVSFRSSVVVPDDYPQATRGESVTLRHEGTHPNPATTAATIDFELPSRSLVTVEIYSIEGEIIRQYSPVEYQSGRSSTVIPLDGVASGSYVVRVGSRFGSFTTKLAVVRQP